MLGPTDYGEILRRDDGRPARIYVKGLLVAEEPEFKFSYNVTSLTAAMNKALNRERTHVGRVAYSDRVKARLLSCAAPEVADILSEEISKIDKGTACYEVRSWTEVTVHACKILNQTKKVVFVSSLESEASRDMVDQVRDKGYGLITLPQYLRDKLRNIEDSEGAPVRGLEVFATEWIKSFKFKFVSESSLTASERSLFAQRDAIAALRGGWPGVVREVLISETMRPDEHGRTGVVGLWDEGLGQILVQRNQLRSAHALAGTLLHELTHASSGEADVSREFESALTDLIGHMAANVLKLTTPAERKVSAKSKQKEAVNAKMPGLRATKVKEPARLKAGRRRR